MNALERAEDKHRRRATAQLAKEIILALPKELGLDDQIRLAEKFANDYFVQYGLAADVNIHDKGDGNPHAHILVSMRRILGEQIAPTKARDLNPVFFSGQVVADDHWHKLWTQSQNAFFIEEDLPFRVDPTSLVPGTHHGRRYDDDEHAQSHKIDTTPHQADGENPGQILPTFPGDTVSPIRQPNPIAPLPNTIIDNTDNPLPFFTPNPGNTVRPLPAQTSSPFSPNDDSAASDNAIIDKEHFYLGDTNTLSQQAAIEIAVNDPRALLSHLTLNQTIISERDIATLIMKHTDNRDDYDNCLIAFKQLPELVALGENEAGFICYTTHALYQKEDNLIQDAEQLRNTPQLTLARQSIIDAIKATHLNTEQAHAVSDIVTGGQLSCLVGRAGTGKSFTAKALNQIYQESGYRVLGAATAGIAAHGLNESSNIPSRVLSSLCYCLRKGFITLSEKDVILIDEAGMVELDMMREVIQAVKSAGAKLILVGDPDQLPAIGQGNPFTAIIEQVGFSELADIQRQEKDGDCEASRLLAAANSGNAIANMNDALAHYDAQGGVHFGTDVQDTHRQLLDDWEHALSLTPIAKQLMLAYRRDDVFALNEKARLRLIKNGTLDANEILLDTANGVRPVRLGERLLCTRNKAKLGMINGQFATLVALTDTHITVKLDNDTQKTLALADYNHFDYGYAVTVHKAQGMSIDNVFIAATGRGWDRFLTYVAMTRHKRSLKLYANQQEHQTIGALARHLARGQVLDSILRYPLSFARRHGMDPDTVLARFIHRLIQYKMSLN